MKKKSRIKNKAYRGSDVTPKKLDFYCVTDLTSVMHFLCSKEIGEHE